MDRDARTIRLPADMVEAAIESAPSSLVLYGRNDPDMDLLIELGVRLLWHGWHFGAALLRLRSLAITSADQGRHGA